MSTQGIKYQRCIPHSSAGQYPDKKVRVLYTVVQQGIVLPALHKRDGLQGAAQMLALRWAYVCKTNTGTVTAAVPQKCSRCYVGYVAHTLKYPLP